MKPVISSGGRIAAVGKLHSGQTNYVALCVDRGHGLEVLLHSGSQAPGLAPGTILTGLVKGPFINAAGQVLIVATIQGPGIQEYKDKTFFVVDRDLIVRPLAWPSMTISLPDDRNVTLETVSYGSITTMGADASGNDDGRVRLFNDRGEFVFVGTWLYEGALQTGLFVARREPSRLEAKHTAPDVIELTLMTDAGWNYQVQWCESLDAASWTDLGVPLAGTGDLVTVPVPVTLATRSMFFRFVATH